MLTTNIHTQIIEIPTVLMVEYIGNIIRLLSVANWSLLGKRLVQGDVD